MNHLSKALFSTLAKSKVGIIGCGNMGHYMAKHLISHGNQVAAYDLQPQALKAAADIGATTCKSISQAAKDKDFVFTMLPRSDISTKVYTQGDDCILNSADKGTILIESSTVSPDTVINIKKQADKRGLIAIDAPVSGGQMGAINATLTFMIGCDDKAHLEKLQPLLKQLGKTVFYCGDVGSGQVAKIANNMIFGVTMLAVSEGMNLAVKHGMDPKLMKEIISVSSGGSFSNNVYNPYPGVIKTAPSSNNYDDGFPLSHMRKDLSLAITAADSKEANLDTVKFAIQKYLDIEKKGHGRKDFSIIFQEIAGKLK